MTMEVATQGFTSGDFRAALGAFATGVTIVTTQRDGHAYGMTANAFSSVSLDPPFVLVCVRTGAEGSEHIARNGVFAVNILGADQEPLSRYFSSKTRPRGRRAFSEVAHRRAGSGSPVLDGVAGYLDCTLHAAHDAGDHRIFIGEVTEIDVAPEVEPLLFHAGRYRFARDPA